MTEAEQRLLEFIDRRLERMLSTPGMWGANESVELQVLQLLELRVVLLVPNGVSLARRIQGDYITFVGREFPGKPPETLSMLLANAGRAHEFSTFLTRFAREQIAKLDGVAGGDVDSDFVLPADPAANRDKALEVIERVSHPYRSGDFGRRAVRFPKAVANR